MIQAAINSGSVPIAAQAVAADSAYHSIALLDLAGCDRLTVTGLVAGTGPLTDLRVSIAAVPGGTMVQRLSDADFNTPTELLPFSTANPHQTTTGNSFQFVMDVRSAAQVLIEAKASGAATVALEVGGSGGARGATAF